MSNRLLNRLAQTYLGRRATRSRTGRVPTGKEGIPCRERDGSHPRGRRAEAGETIQRYHELEQRILTSLGLSPQENTVALHVLLSEPYRETAAALYLSESTVKFHARNIFKKAQVKGRYEFEHMVRRRLENLMRL